MDSSPKLDFNVTMFACMFVRFSIDSDMREDIREEKEKERYSRESLSGLRAAYNTVQLYSTSTKF